MQSLDFAFPGDDGVSRLMVFCITWLGHYRLQTLNTRELETILTWSWPQSLHNVFTPMLNARVCTITNTRRPEESRIRCIGRAGRDQWRLEAPHWQQQLTLSTNINKLCPDNTDNCDHILIVTDIGDKVVIAVTRAAEKVGREWGHLADTLAV